MVVTGQFARQNKINNGFFCFRVITNSTNFDSIKKQTG